MGKKRLIWWTVVLMLLCAVAVNGAEARYRGGKTQGEDGWYALCAQENTDIWEFLPTYSGGNWWAGENNFSLGLVNAYGIHPGLYYDAVLAWQAPESGEITISVPGGATCVDSSTEKKPGDGVAFGIFYQDDSGVKPVYPAEGLTYIPMGETMDIPDQTLSVQKGALVLFRIGCGGNNYMDYDSTSMAPVISYNGTNDEPAVKSNLLPPEPGEKERYPLASMETIPYPTLDVTPKEMTGEAFLAMAKREGDTVTFPAGLYAITDTLVLAEDDTIYQMDGVELWGGKVEITGAQVAIDTLCLVCCDVQVTGDCVTFYNCCLQLEAYALRATGDGLTVQSCYIDGHFYVEGRDTLFAWCPYKYFHLECTGDNVTLYGNFCSVMEAGAWHFSGCQDISVIGNTFDPMYTKITLDNCAYVNFSDNVVYGKKEGESSYEAVLCTNFWSTDDTDFPLWGNNVYPHEDIATDYGADMNRIPDNHKERFQNGVIREKIYYNGQFRSPTSVIAAMSGRYQQMVLPCGVYENLPTISLYKEENFALYGYGALLCFENFTTGAIWIDESHDLAVCGVTIDFMALPNAQGTVLSAEGGKVVWRCDEGYGSDITDTSKFLPDGMAHIFRDGLPVGDTAFSARTKNGDGTVTLTGGGGIQAGDRLVFRGKGAHVITVQRSGQTDFRDVTVWAGSGFGWSGWEGEGPVTLSRCLVMPGPKPDNATVERTVSTCDATHFSNMRKGPTLTDCHFTDMTDDGTNINGHYTVTEGYNAEKRTFTCQPTFTVTTGTYSSQLSNIQPGDLLRILTQEGQLIGEVKATSDGASNRVTIDTDWLTGGDENIPANGRVVLQNISACGEGFLLRNCVVERIRSRGLLIKTGGTIEHCTIIDTRMAGILVKPESADWPEFGFTTDLVIRYCHILRNGYAATGDDLFSAICVEGDVRATEDKAYQLHRNILVEGNCIEARKNNIALKLSHVNGGVVKDNIFLPRHESAYANPAADPGAPVLVIGSSNVELVGNTWPENAKLLKNGGKSVNVYGTDIGVEPTPETETEAVPETENAPIEDGMETERPTETKPAAEEISASGKVVYCLIGIGIVGIVFVMGLVMGKKKK